MGFEETKAELLSSPRNWSVTGAAGFIGSNLVEALLRLDQRVTGLDNLSTGHAGNLAQVQAAVGPAHWKNFNWIEGDIRDLDTCLTAVRGADYVLHNAALGSGPRSLARPLDTNASNVTGFMNILWAVRESGVRRLVYASSSSVYGDSPEASRMEENLGNCLTPYAVSKRANELYASVFSRCYGTQCIGLRYFNVFGPRQNPDGPYAAVIPRWIGALLQNQPVFINGDGSITRDFCHVANVIQSALLAATISKPEAVNAIYNVAAGTETSLIALFEMLRDRLQETHPHVRKAQPAHRPARIGDPPRSRADITRARSLLGYAPTHSVEKGLDETVSWYVAMHINSKAAQRAPEQVSP